MRSTLKIRKIAFAVNFLKIIILLLQKRKVGANGKPIDDEIESFEAIKVKAGDKKHITPEIGHLMVNTGDVWLVTSDDSPVYESDVDPAGLPGHADYEAVKRMGGFAYFVIEKDGVPTLIKNPKYNLTMQTIFAGANKIISLLISG